MCVCLSVFDVCDCVLIGRYEGNKLKKNKRHFKLKSSPMEKGEVVADLDSYEL